MIFPTLNNNGDTAKTLINQQRVVSDAAIELLNALRFATPHGRNFQTVDLAVGRMARKEHEDKCKIVQQIQDEAMLIAVHCDN